MLARLSLQNIAVIESVEIEFGNGLNIITGETGAGKSILVSSLGLILGNRATDSILRTGARTGFIEALFILPCNTPLNCMLDNAGIEVSSGLSIRRTFSDSGKNRHFVNGCTVSLSFLKELGNELVDIHGQHDHQALLNPENQLTVLDKFAETIPLREELELKYASLAKVESRINRISESEKERADRLDFLKFQKNEIEEAGLSGVDEESLGSRQKLLKSSEKRAELAGAAYNLLYGDELACLDRLSSVLASMEEMEEHDPELHSHTEELRNAFFSIEGISLFLREYMDRVSCLPEELMDIERSISGLNRLKRKYGKSVEEILKKLDSISAEIDALTLAADSIDSLKKESDSLKKEVSGLAKALAEKREEAALTFKNEVERELGELKMEKVVFDIVFHYREEPGSFVFFGGKPVSVSSKGIGRMEFFFSPNTGEERRPLARIASGGELSRVMLALKKVLAEKDMTPVLIFDEIDTGISGGTAEIVGGKIKDVSSCHQVFCITHLPQIASLGDSHFLIRKEVSDGKTKTTAEELSEEKRVKEIARMAGGVDITDTTLKHAREMISRGTGWKKMNAGQI